MPLGLHDPRAEARRTEAVLDPSAVGGVHEAAGQRDAVNRAALRLWRSVFTHGDLQVAHVFVDVDEITGMVDWSEAGRGDARHTSPRSSRPDSGSARRGEGRTERRLPALAGCTWARRTE